MLDIYQLVLIYISTLQKVSNMHVYVYSECQTQHREVIFYGASHSWLGCYVMFTSGHCSLRKNDISR